MIPIRNLGSEDVTLAIEPDGHAFVIRPQTSVEIRFRASDVPHLDLEIAADGSLLAIYCSYEKNVYIDGVRVMGSIDTP